MVCKRKTLCPTCQVEVTNNNLKRHIASCTGKPKTLFPSGTRGGWNRGLKMVELLDSGLITQEKYDNAIAASKKGGRNSPGQPYDEDARRVRNERARENAIKNELGGHTSKVRLHFQKNDGTSVYLHSSYEIEFATILESLNVEWTRPDPIPWIDENGVSHRYYPDFQVGEIYIDTKNDYLAVKDLPKIEAVRTQNQVDVRILKKEHINEKFIRETILR